MYKDDATKAMVTKWIGWYKRHRATLIHPIVHIRRATMQSWDGWCVSMAQLRCQLCCRYRRCCPSPPGPLTMRCADPRLHVNPFAYGSNGTAHPEVKKTRKPP